MCRGGGEMVSEAASIAIHLAQDERKIDIDPRLSRDQVCHVIRHDEDWSGAARIGVVCRCVSNGTNNNWSIG